MLHHQIGLSRSCGGGDWSLGRSTSCNGRWQGLLVLVGTLSNGRRQVVGVLRQFAWYDEQGRRAAWTEIAKLDAIWWLMKSLLHKALAGCSRLSHFRKLIPVQVKAQELNFGC